MNLQQNIYGAFTSGTKKSKYYFGIGGITIAFNGLGLYFSLTSSQISTPRIFDVLFVILPQE